MLRADTPTNPSEIQGRMDAITAVMDCLRGPDYGTDFYVKLGQEWTRLSALLTNGSSRGIGTPAMATRSAGRPWSQSCEEYAADEAAWARSRERRQLVARQPGSWRLPPPAPKRLPPSEATSVRLDADTEPRVTVHISRSAMAAIAAECARCGDLESGGGLVGHRAASWHADHTVVEATVAVRARSRSSMALDTSAFMRTDERLVSEWRTGKGFKLRAVGDWHSHPGCTATPSENDLQCWARDLATLTDRDASLTSLIVTQREGSDSWARPVVTAWITRPARASFGERFVVERATVSIR